MSNTTVFTTPILSHTTQDPAEPAVKSESKPSDQEVPVKAEAVEPEGDAADGNDSQGSDDSDDWETDSLYRDLITDETIDTEHLNSKRFRRSFRLPLTHYCRP